ncbi:MAG: hypothetical protein [Olavius algarvensis Delta 4 endosymbiont]|nr:MAG: hypothetical protein [Olavius algarvensis Delta 4 endosymbiont]
MNTFLTMLFCFSGRWRTGNQRLHKNPLQNPTNLIWTGASVAAAAHVVKGG